MTLDEFKALPFDAELEYVGPGYPYQSRDGEPRMLKAGARCIKGFKTIGGPTVDFPLRWAMRPDGRSWDHLSIRLTEENVGHFRLVRPHWQNTAVDGTPLEEIP